MRIWHRVLQAILQGKSSRSNARNDTSLQLESLEIRSLLASHPLADAPDVDYEVTDEWSTGHSAALTLTNDESTSFSNWQLEFDYNGQIDSLWNAEVTNLGGGRYAITPPDWDNTLDAGESLAIGFSASGSSGISNITFNGTGDVAPEDPIAPPVTPPADQVDPPTDPVDSPVDETPVTPPIDTNPVQLPILTISDAQVAEGDSGFVLATFTVALSKASTETVSVDFHTMTNTASSGTDFERTEGTITFAAGETSTTIDVRVYGDLEVENDEHFEVMLTSPSGAIFETTPDAGTDPVITPVVPGEPLEVPTSGTFDYLSGTDSFRVMDLTSTGAHNVQLMVTSSGNLVVLGPFNGNPIQQHETLLAELIANVSTDFLETRLPDPEEDPNQMIGTWMQDPIGGLQISNAHLYCDAAGLFLGEKLGVVGGQGDVGYVVTSHRMDDSGTPVVNVIDGFDPTTDKLDFQYFSNREFAIADSADGVVISASPQAYNAWGEKTLLRGVTFSQLTEENFIFRFEQKYEDGFNRFGGTSENTPTDGTRDIPVVSSPLGNQNSGDGVTSGSDFSYEIANTWDAGYVSQWTYAPQSAVGSWQVTLQIDGEITSVWNAEILSQDSGTYVIGNADFNGGLATGQTTAFGFDASGSSGSIQILSGSVQQNPSQDDDATTTTGWETHIIGDSIAVGLQYQNPAALGYALVGSNPTTIYNEILAGGYQLQGARVLLSSGIMNNTIDFAGVENQLQYLTAQGASVRLVGAADGNYDSHNQQLATLAEQYGVTFMGGFTPGTDGVHPPDYQYADLYAVVSQMDSSEHGDLPDDGMDMITGVLSGFGTILNDDVADPVAPPVDEDPVTPPMDDHDDHMSPPPSSGNYIDITTWGMFHDSNNNSEHDELVGGRTAITTEAMEAYNNLRSFLGLSALTIEDVGEWAFAESLTNNSQAWGDDIQGVGLYYAMQGAKVGWIADESYDPQILADIQRTARLGDPDDVMDMVRQFGHEGFADYLEQYGIEDTFINTLKMEPHYGGWMHGRTHGFRSIEGVAINHDINHLTVLSWDQMQPFMNDTFDWPQWPALDVSDSGVIEYFQSMVTLGDPVGENMEFAPAPVMPPMDEHDPGDGTQDPVTPPVDETPVEPPADPVTPPVDETPVDPPSDPVSPPVGDDLVQVADIEILEGDSGSSQAIFTVNRSFTDSPLTLTYATEDGSAVAGEDYLATSGTLTLAIGQSSALIAVTILGDTQFEANESFTLAVRSVEAEEPPVSTPADPQNPVEQPVVAAYYPEWGIYGRNYQIADVPGDDLTHFIYAFANLTASGEMVLFDGYAATEKRFSADESVSGEADLWDYPAEDPRSQQTVWGNFNQVSQLKAKYPHLRTSIALGGWTLSGNFSSVCSTDQGRETLASSIYDFLGTYTMFDGIDFDWEYPGGGGLGGNSESPQDGANYASLLELVREKLDSLGSENGRYYEITVASPGGSDKIANFNVSGVNQYVDFFNVMTYDFHGTWENTTGHQAALTNDPAGYDIQTSVNLYLDAGVESDKIILGAPAYTRAWNGVADGGDNGYAESASGAAPGTFESGNYDYKDLASQYLADTSDWELNWDDDAQAAYLYSEGQGIFSSFETPGSISLKSEWAQDLNLGGMMFWDLSNDLTGNESLIGAAADSWFAGKTFTEITSASDLVFDNIYGGNGLFDPVVESDTTPSTPQTLTGEEILVDLTATATILNDDANAIVDFVQILDNGDAGFTQTGFTYMNIDQVAGALNGDIHYVRGGSGIATWTFDNLESGEYRIATTWAGKYDNKYNASDAPYTVSDAAGNILAQAVVDQFAVPADFEDAGKSWHSLATVTVADGTITVTLSEGSDANLYVVADAVRIERVSTDAPTDPPADPVTPPPDDPPAEDPVDPPVNDPVGSAQILDNGDAGFTQTGFTYMNIDQVAGALNGDIHYVRGGSGIATWTFDNLESGEYRIATTWAGKYDNKYNASDAPYTVSDAAGNILAQAVVDQFAVPADFEDAGKSWHSLATVTVADGTITVTLSEGSDANLYVVADAVRIERVSTDAPTDPPADPVTPPPDDPPAEDPVDPPVNDPVGSAQILDNGDAGFTQTGFTYMNIDQVAGALNGDIHYVRGGSGIATWTFDNLESGEYRIATTWAGKYDNKYNASDAPYTVSDAAGNILAQAVVDQFAVPADFEDAGKSWHSLATVTVADGTITVTLSEGSDANLYVVADAVRIERVSTDAPTDPPADPVTPPPDSSSLEVVAATTSVSVLVDTQTGLAYVQDDGDEPILITRSDDYWQGDVPLTRDDATIQAAARDELGRLRVLDGGGVDVYAWILNDSGLFIGEEGPTTTSIHSKEVLFQLDIDGNGAIGQADPVAPPVDEDPVTPPMDDHDDHMSPPPSSGNYIDITTWGMFHDSNNNSEHDELVGGRTAITTEAMEAYNNLRSFLGLSALTIEDVGEWAFAESLTNNSQAWGDDIQGVGLYYAMQGAKVGWIADESYDPQILADIQRTARLGDPDDVMDMVRQFGHEGFADYLEQYGIEDTFINTLKMEPHYGGWMHGRTHGFRSIEGVAINHDINHLTVLSWDQMQPFMNDTFDWPQWPALDVSDSGVIEYFQSMVTLGDPVGENME